MAVVQVIRYTRSGTGDAAIVTFDTISKVVSVTYEALNGTEVAEPDIGTQEVIYSACDGTTLDQILYIGIDNPSYVPEENSVSCGYIACDAEVHTIDVTPTSFGNSDGKAVINATSTHGPIQYRINNSSLSVNRPLQLSNIFDNLSADNYTVIIEDANGCTDNQGFIITEGAAPPPSCDLAVQSVQVTGNAINQVVINATTSNGTLAYSIDNFATQQSSNTFQNFPAGITRVYIKDALNCTAFIDVEIPVVPVEIFFSRNPIWFSVPGAAIGQEVELELWAESAHYACDFQKIITRRRAALTDGSCAFELESILDSLVSRSPDLPDLTISASTVCTQGILNYYVTYAIVSAAGEPGTWTASDYFTVIKGALPYEDFKTVDFFSTYLDSKPQFLTWCNRVKKVTAAQKEYLYFLNRIQARSALRIQRKYYQAGNAEPVIETENIDFPGNFNIFQLVRMTAYPNLLATTVKVEVSLLDPDNFPISETRIYNFVENLQGTDRFFLFENSLGGLDTMRATGERNILLDGKDELAEKMLMPDQALSTGQLQVFSHDVSRKFKQSVGLLTPADHEVLQEFIYARNRYEIIGNKLLPIILQKRGYAHQVDGKRPEAYAFEYSYAFDSKAYANFK